MTEHTMSTDQLSQSSTRQFSHQIAPEEAAENQLSIFLRPIEAHFSIIDDARRCRRRQGRYGLVHCAQCLVDGSSGGAIW